MPSIYLADQRQGDICNMQHRYPTREMFVSKKRSRNKTVRANSAQFAASYIHKNV